MITKIQTNEIASIIEQVKRNRNRFPCDFMFQLNSDELIILNRSQFATGSEKHRDPRLTKVCRIIKTLLEEPVSQKEPIGFRRN